MLTRLFLLLALAFNPDAGQDDFPSTVKEIRQLYAETQRAIAMMSEEEYEQIENKILEEVGSDGRFSGDVAEALGMTSTMLKSLVRRSVKMDFRGHRIEIKHDE